MVKTILIIGSAENPLRPAESQLKLRKGLPSPREGSLRSEEAPFIATADSLRQTADVFRPNFVRSVKRRSGRQNAFLPS